MKATILKRFNVGGISEEQQMVYGWASVYEKSGQPVVDKQGDRISEREVVKMAQRFVRDARIAKTMHGSPKTGDVVESMVFTRELQRALGIDLGFSGWLVGIHVSDPETWARVKSGELRTLSIGGTGIRTPVAKRDAMTRVLALLARIDRAFEECCAAPNS